jgi:UDP-N-acetylmuramate: L-alanyl-gamma-D-glutamyl-meso-diaminopimelate ligase
MKIHFIAIGGSAMHNLAIALYKKGYHISGSDDEIFEPSKSRLAKYGLLPEEIGWNPDNITNDIDAIVLGMHARQDNPELIKAQQLGIKIYSYPEYLYEQSRDKIRIVIGGSHGKTTITSIIIHVLSKLGIDCDYMVGAQLDGFEVMVKLSHEAKYMVIEGDEYLTSPIDRRPKFHLYKPNIALISGIAWDHINVFPTFRNYTEQFEKFANLITQNGSLVYCENDNIVKQIAKNCRNDIKTIPYNIPPYTIKEGKTFLQHNNKNYELNVFGEHNLMNINGAMKVLNQIGINDEDFLNAVISFKGASKRLELIVKNNNTQIFKDFAHSPSKLKATINAVKNQFPDRKLVACIELHTFSSLNKEFLQQYKGCMDNADYPVVYYNPKTIEHKKLQPITKEDIISAFDNNLLNVFTQSNEVVSFLKSINWHNKNLLLMTSGNFDGIILEDLAKEFLEEGQ